MARYFLLNSLICLLLFSEPSFAQVVFEGKVKDTEQALAIPYAHVYLKQSGIGVVTNMEGEFRLVVEESLLPDTLVVSCLGYNSYWLTVSAAQQLELQLVPQEYLLSVVTVTAPPLQEQIDSARLILEHAIGRIRRLYPNHAHFYKAFYRETSASAFQKQYLQLLEAAVHIQGFRAGAATERLRLEVLQLRRSEDGRTFSAWDKVWGLVFGDRNELYDLYNSNMVYTIARNYNGSGRMSRHFAEKHDVYLQGHTYQDSTRIFIIGYHTPYSQGFPYYEGRIWVRADDWAIVKITEAHKENPHKKVSWSTHATYPPQRTYEFRKQGSRYYLAYAEKREMQNLEHGKSESGEYVLTKWEYNSRMLMVSEVLSSRSEYDRIRNKSKLAEDSYLRDMEFPYDSQFWESYNAVKLNPLDSQLKEDLEKATTLEKQFKKNGSKH
jgi:hypothetical protein